LLSATTGQFEILACQIAFQAVQVMIVDTFMESINDSFLSRQVALIYPLKVGFVPLLAGVLGHQGCVVGVEPGMLDKMIGGMTGGGLQEGTDDGWGYLTMVLNFIGIQAINYGNVIPQDE
jgi:hypothetical protein